ncbi:hypothetical protein EJV47_05895 [Hymenobacter gummosus]|uniref:DUF6896 domain-containing protein n=1 Tax=Hymenobacter gummosus TaxID=1776032 RepID=A0A3S0K816_9BACT|nr:hypothetical protein [Hymenobacter gummosus]RTQ52541.1 hypothetical protein EJV47_05895 [Hymenobacter gummosus]
MSFSTAELVALLRRYQAAVLEAVALMRRHDFSTTLLAIYRSGPLGPAGRARYEFHGSGCLVRLPDGHCVDFDFGFDERHEAARVDMLDPGFVQDYYEQLHGPATNSTTLFLALKAGMEALARAGVLVQPDVDYPRFCFATDWHNPQPATFSPNAVPLGDEPALLAQLDRFCYQLY